MMKKIDWFQLIVIILITELIGLLSSLLSGNAGQIYTSFVKPPLSPPGWLFGVIWPVLYLLMGIAAYIIYQTPQTPEQKRQLLYIGYSYLLTSSGQLYFSVLSGIGYPL